MVKNGEVSIKSPTSTEANKEALSKLRKVIRSFQLTCRGDARAQDRVKAVNTLLVSGHDLSLLKDNDIQDLWESIFFALWHAEMGRGCEEIIAAITRACSTNYRLTKTGFKTIAAKWYGLDHYRVDKVSHLSRHLLPVLLEQQIKLWFKACKKGKKLGTRDIVCPQLLRRMFEDIVDSFGLCYFMLEILADEISKTLINVYERLNITVGKFELKANLIIFLYKQVINFATNIKLDARLLRTFDQYVIRKFIQDVLPNESQLTQILVSLRFYQALDKYRKRSKNPPTGKCKALLVRWSTIIQDVHEKCINGEHFPTSIVPIKDTAPWQPHYTISKSLTKSE